MARISQCDFKEDGCNDGRCKVNVCILDQDEQKHIREMVITYLQRDASDEVVERTIQLVRDDPKYAAHVRNAAGLFSLRDAAVDSSKRVRALREPDQS